MIDFKSRSLPRRSYYLIALITREVLSDWLVWGGKSDFVGGATVFSLNWVWVVGISVTDLVIPALNLESLKIILETVIGNPPLK